MTYGLRLFAFFSLIAALAGATAPAKLKTKKYSKAALTKKLTSTTLADDDSGDDDDDDDEDNRATV